mmetsp:Transcript_8366/g.20877  ORF Transcript_8366/g.20877 Transcript_8366/m.20877 type:complete len:223 (+) Transcript_8366:370-1038(+)
MSSSTTATTHLLSRAWQAYLAKLRTDPLVTKSTTAALLSIVSDVVARIPFGSSSGPRPKLLLPTPMAHEFAIGLALRGPVVHFWHNLLDLLLPQTTAATVLAKVALDQLVFAPFFNALYFYAKGVLQGREVGEINEEVRRKLWAVMKTNWAVWVPVNAVAYALIPLELRVLWGNLFGIIWTALLITMAKSGRPAKKTPAGPAAAAPAAASQEAAPAAGEKTE